MIADTTSAFFSLQLMRQMMAGKTPMKIFMSIFLVIILSSVIPAGAIPGSQLAPANSSQPFPLWEDHFEPSHSVSGIQVACSDDGQHIAVGADHGVVRMYDNRGKILWTYENPDPDATISDIAISGNGNFIGAGVYHFFNDTNEIVYFNNTGHMGWEFPVQPFGYVALSGDGQMIAASGSNFYILNAAGEVLNTRKFNESIFRVAISDDGQYAAAGTGLNAWVYVMDTNGTMLWARKTDGTYDNHGGIRALQVSRHGDRIIAQDIGGVYFFTREGTFSKSDKENNHFERHGSRSSENGEYTVSFNNEKILYYDSTGKKIWEYQISTFSDIRSFTVSDVGISGDGKYVAAIGSYDSLYVLDNKGNLIWKYRLSSSGHRIALSHNGKYIAVATQDSLYFFNIDGTPTMPEPVITQTTAIKGSAPVTTGTPKASLPVFIIMLALGVGGIIYNRNGKDR